jgi:hypothetical protein
MADCQLPIELILLLILIVILTVSFEKEDEDDDEDDWKTLDFGLWTLDFNLRACQKC